MDISPTPGCIPHSFAIKALFLKCTLHFSSSMCAVYSQLQCSLHCNSIHAAVKSSPQFNIFCNTLFHRHTLLTAEHFWLNTRSLRGFFKYKKTTLLTRGFSLDKILKPKVSNLSSLVFFIVTVQIFIFENAHSKIFRRITQLCSSIKFLLLQKSFDLVEYPSLTMGSLYKDRVQNIKL